MREFSVAGAYVSDQRGPVRWVASHLLRYGWAVVVFIIVSVAVNVAFDFNSVLVGQAFNDVLHSRSPHQDLARDGLLILAVVLITGTIDVSARSLSELLGKRLARDGRDELYLSLLGKSQLLPAVAFLRRIYVGGARNNDGREKPMSCRWLYPCVHQQTVAGVWPRCTA